MQAIIIASNQEDREFLSFVLRHTGLAVARSAEVQLVKSSLHERPVDLILLAPGKSTALVEDVREIRSVSQAPLLVLIDSLTEEQYCALLDSGVDLVLERPLSPRILTRYVRIFLRRTGFVPTTLLASVDGDGLVLDPDTRTVTVNGQDAHPLTPLEFRLLYILMANRGQVIPIDTIVERVWGYNGEGNRELVRGLVRRLRRKIEPDVNEPHFIHNWPGIGYQFEVKMRNEK